MADLWGTDALVWLGFWSAVKDCEPHSSVWDLLPTSSIIFSSSVIFLMSCLFASSLPARKWMCANYKLSPQCLRPTRPILHILKPAHSRVLAGAHVFILFALRLGRSTTFQLKPYILSNDHLHRCPSPHLLTLLVCKGSSQTDQACADGGSNSEKKEELKIS